MKKSPLLLRWVSYPSASYEIVDTFAGQLDAISPANVEAEVRYSTSGNHMASLKISSCDGDGDVPYNFSVSAVAAFEFDLEIARQEYNSEVAEVLSRIIAVNISRILFAGAREHLAMMTARAPHGVTVLASIILEVSDVTIRSSESPLEVLEKVFSASPEELEKIGKRMAAIEAMQVEDGNKVKAKKSKKDPASHSAG